MGDRRTAQQIYGGIEARGLDPRGTLRFSALIVDVRLAAVEPLVELARSDGFRIERILPDPDDDALFFVQVSETRVHDEASFTARSDSLDARAERHAARVADWSVTRAP